ncbi:MAG: flagellar basal body rod protein FlgC [Gammaproteobacteria bacterium]|nr:MAG: flagellar basal body rod protein FlgC [Gammaproteobacteria bacterium]
MSLYNIFGIAGSALSANSVMLNTTASNIANAQSVSSSSGETYRGKYPVFETLYQNKLNKTMHSPGVKVTDIVDGNADPIRKHSPDHPMADSDGFIYTANINIIEEMANMIAASRSYQTNLQVATTAKQLLQRTLTLGQ